MFMRFIIKVLLLQCVCGYFGRSFIFKFVVFVWVVKEMMLFNLFGVREPWRRGLTLGWPFEIMRACGVVLTGFPLLPSSDDWRWCRWLRQCACRLRGEWLVV